MKTRELTHIALLACIMYVGFVSFSSVLYLEVITVITVLIGVTFKLKESLMASLVFAMINLLTNGIFPWTIMYLILFPCFSFLSYALRNLLIKSHVTQILICFLFSFLLGQLVDLPFMLFSGKVTMLYLLLGLKTSLIQGVITAIEAALFFDTFYIRIKKVMEGHL